MNNFLKVAYSTEVFSEKAICSSIGKSKPLYISFSIDCEDEGWIRSLYSKKGARLLFAGFDYEFEITPHKRGSGFAITQDHISLSDFPASCHHRLFIAHIGFDFVCDGVHLVLKLFCQLPQVHQFFHIGDDALIRVTHCFVLTFFDWSLCSCPLCSYYYTRFRVHCQVKSDTIAC